MLIYVGTAVKRNFQQRLRWFPRTLVKLAAKEVSMTERYQPLPQVPVQPAQQQQAAPQTSPPVQDAQHRTATPEESKQELRNAIKGSNQVLASATTALTFFPDTLTVDRAKLTLTKRTFFQTAEVMSIRIEDVLNVTAILK